jgi:ubiquinone/menaquinone biosynthesis C-methylase UbiE
MHTRTHWPKASHERAVERFYSHGANGQTEIHGGFLNFGLWEEGIEDYIAAAQNLIGRLAKMLGLRPGSRLLDVACGMGSQDIYLQRAFGPLEIDAMDVTWSHVERAVRRAREEHVTTGLRFHHGTATNLPFRGSSFTHLMSIEGPEHFDTRRAFLEEAFRVLRPGGRLCLADYTVARVPRGPFERALFAVTCRLWKVPRPNVCTAPEYLRQIEASGFREASLDHVGALTFPGYYREQCRSMFRREMRRLQGRAKADLGHVINVLTNRAYTLGLVDYVLVRATKPPDAPD